MYIFKKNPYFRYLTKEQKMHAAFMNYARLQYPNELITHYPNEGKRTKFEQYLIKVLGIKSGMPDVMVYKNNNKYCGLAIELKVGSNEPTKNQMECLDRLEMNGWCTRVGYTLDSCIEELDKYMKIT